jgi:hypothetical protein
MLTRWASIYIDKYLSVDKQEAERWATRTVPKMYHKKLAAKVKELIQSTPPTPPKAS